MPVKAILIQTSIIVYSSCLHKILQSWTTLTSKGSSAPSPQLASLAAAAAPPQDMEMDPEDQEAFNRAQAIRGQRKGFRLESICWD